MAKRNKRPCKHCRKFHWSSRAARKCALRVKRRKGGPAWTDKELGV